MVRIKSLLNILSTIVAVLSLAPVLPYLGTGIIVIACSGVLIGFWCDRREQYPLQGIAATILTAAAIIFYALQISWVDLATPVTKALIVLLVVRLMTPKESRDYLQIFLLALFILAASSLVSLDLGLGFGFLTYLVLQVFAVILGLVLLTVYVTDKRLAMPKADFYKLVRVSMIMPVVALMLMVVFFFILPRTRHPMWNFLNPGGTAKAGLAESVEPGNYARISSLKDLAFRAVGEELAPEDLYWRALVLNQPVENRWVRVDPPNENSRPVDSSKAVKLTIYSEAKADRYLVVLDRPASISGIRYRSDDDFVYSARSALERPFRVETLSHINADLQINGKINRNFYLTLPTQISQRMRDLAASLAGPSTSHSERIAALAGFFRNQQLTYAEDNLPGGADPIDDFLFEKKRGYCEFFASAYVTLARMLGIPARLVGGYLGGEYNPFGGYYLVTEDKAHVWVEVLTDDSRWQRIDPSQWAVNAATSINNRNTADLGALQRLSDALNYRWVQGVLLFDFYRQIDFLRDTRETFRKLRSPRIDYKYGLWLIGLVCLIAGGYFLKKFRRHSPEQRLIEALYRRLRKRYGTEKVSPVYGLQELGERLDNEECRAFARIYQGAVFKDRALNADEERQLKELLKKI